MLLFKQIQLLGVLPVIAPIKAHYYLLYGWLMPSESLYSCFWSFIGCCEFPSEVDNACVLTQLSVTECQPWLA